MIITLDGPSGSGKSTLAQLVAQKLGFFYINSGYLYRSLAYILVTDFGYDNEQLRAPSLNDIKVIFHDSNFIYQYQNGVAQVFFKGKEITHHLKYSKVSDHASLISADAQVRAEVVIIQRKFGEMHNLVTDGRDGGTEIYPQAIFKFYITAQAEIRAQRLQSDLERSGMNITFEEALHMTQTRDARDMTRLISPLKKAEDAIEIDTSDQSVHQILEFMLSIIHNKYISEI